MASACHDKLPSATTASLLLRLLQEVKQRLESHKMFKTYHLHGFLLEKYFQECGLSELFVLFVGELEYCVTVICHQRDLFPEGSWYI